MNKTQLFLIGGAVVVSGIAFFVIRNLMRKKNAYSSPVLNPVVETPAITPESYAPIFKPEQHAEALYKSMKGIGKGPDVFLSAVQGLNFEQRKKVRDVFNSKFGDGTDLCGWIEGDFSGGTETKLLALFGYPTGAIWSNCQ